MFRTPSLARTGAAGLFFAPQRAVESDLPDWALGQAKPKNFVSEAERGGVIQMASRSRKAAT
jgi:hypothetical protein